MKKIENIIIILCAPALLWIMYIVTVGIQKAEESKALKVLLDTYKAECALQQDQILELITSQQSARTEAYSQGYEAGKVYMGIAQIQGKGMVDYADGYHAAISQYHLNQLGGTTVQVKENE